MTFKIKDKKEITTSSYDKEYEGIKEIFLIRDNKKAHIFTNKLAMGGIWLNSQQLEDILKILELKLISGDEILVKSYKVRSLNDQLIPKSGADCKWSIEIE